MISSMTTVLFMSLLISIPLVNGFYVFFPQANDRILAFGIADPASSKSAENGVLVDPEQAMMTEKRTYSNRGIMMRRRSAESYACPCLHKVCTYHCMTK